MWKDPTTGQERGGIAKVRYSHEAMADLILMNPAITQREIAGHFGYTEGWVCQVIGSDAFQAFIAERREQIVDPLVKGAVEEGMRGLVLQSMQRLRDKLDANPSDQLVLETFKAGARALGYGARVEVHGNISHTHGLIGVLANLPSERVVESLPEAPAPA